jgi:hypothetical protein
MVDTVSTPSADGNRERAITRTFHLPFGYRATFCWRPGELLEVRWTPDRPLIRKERSQRKFLAAYQIARRSFFEEVAAALGGNVLIIDGVGPQNVAGTEMISAPTRH